LVGINSFFVFVWDIVKWRLTGPRLRELPAGNAFINSFINWAEKRGLL